MGMIDYDKILSRSRMLNSQDIVILFFINDSGSISSNSISAELGINTIDLSNSLNKLCSAGLVINRHGNLMATV